MISHHIFYQPCGVSRCGSFEYRVVHFGGVVSLVGNGPDDHKGNAVQIRSVCNGNSLHFGTVALELADQAFLDRFIGDKLVSADHAADHYMNIRIHLFTGTSGKPNKGFVRFKFPEADLGHFAGLITENSHIQVMMNGIPGDQDISDIQLRVKGACHPGINDMGHFKNICKDLRTEGGVHLPDAAAHNYHIGAVQGAFVKFHPGFLDDPGSLHFGFELIHLQIHCSNNPYFIHWFSPFYCG